MRNVRGNTSVISHRNPRRALNGNKPRQIADGVCFIFCPTSGRTLCMGFHPLFRLNFRRRSGFLRRALAPHQAKPGLFSGGVSSIKGTSCNRVSPAGIQDCVSRVIPAPGNPVSTGSITSRERRNRLGHRAKGTLGKSCSSRNLFSRHQNPAPEKPQRQPQTAAEILCEVAVHQRPELKGPVGQFPFPRKALSGRLCAPRPIWI